MIKTYTSLFITILFISSRLYGQVITIVEETTLLPVENVMVFNQDQRRYFLTDKTGQITLNHFQSNDTIYFRHPSFKLISYSYKELSLLEKVYLQETMVSLSEVIVAASKWEQNKAEVSNKISSIKPKSIELENPQTAADLLGISGEVFVQKSQMGGGSPMIRGFSTNTVLLVVDGVRLNNAIYRQGNVQNVINLDANIMDGSEILFGPGSVIYGSDALGGVMDFHTRKALLSTSDEVLVKANGMFRFSTANSENTGHLDFIVANQNLSSVSSISYSLFDDLRMGNIDNDNPQYLSNRYVLRADGRDSVYKNPDPNIQRFSGYDQLNLMQKFRYKPTDSMEFIYAFHFSTTSNIPRYDALRQDKNGRPKFADWSYGPQEWQMHALTIKGYSKCNWFDEYKIISAYQNYNESRLIRYFNEVERLEQMEQVDIVSMNADFNKKINPKSETFYGLELIYNGLNSTAQTRNVDTYELIPGWTLPRYPDGDNNYWSSAAYIGYKNRLNPKTTVNTGLRYSLVHLSSTFENEYYSNFGFDPEFKNQNGAVNGSLGIAWRPKPTWQINGNLSSGFHAPNWDGLGKTFAPKKDVVMVPNQALKPEYAYNAELGLLKYLNNEAISVEGSIFYTYVVGPIVEGDFTLNGQDSIMYHKEWHQIKASVNADHANIYGFNLKLHADLTKRIGLKSYLNLTKGSDSNGDKLRHVAPFFGSTHLFYQVKKLKVDLSTQYHGEMKDLAPSERDKDYMYALEENGALYSPRWWTVNAKIMYQLSPRIQINAGVENLLNKRYRPYSSGIVAPGRNFILALRGKI